MDQNRRSLGNMDSIKLSINLLNKYNPKAKAVALSKRKVLLSPECLVEAQQLRSPKQTEQLFKQIDRMDVKLGRCNTAFRKVLKNLTVQPSEYGNYQSMRSPKNLHLAAQSQGRLSTRATPRSKSKKFNLRDFFETKAENIEADCKVELETRKQNKQWYQEKRAQTRRSLHRVVRQIPEHLDRKLERELFDHQHFKSDSGLVKIAAFKKK